MRAHGHATTWGTHIGVGHTHETKRWYNELKTWWAAYKAARHDAELAALHSRWDAGHRTHQRPVAPTVELDTEGSPCAAALAEVYYAHANRHGPNMLLPVEALPVRPRTHTSTRSTTARPVCSRPPIAHC